MRPPFGLQVDPGQPCGLPGVASYTIGGKYLQYGQQQVLKLGALDNGDRSPGNFGAMNLGASGGNNYRDLVATGYSGWIASCDHWPTLTGNLVGPTIKGIDDRLRRDSIYDTWENCGLTDPPVGFSRWSDCRRIIIIPVIDPPDSGHSDMIIQTFAFFFIEDYTQGAQSQLKGRFIDMKSRRAPPASWRGYQAWDPSTSLPYAVRLLE